MCKVTRWLSTIAKLLYRQPPRQTVEEMREMATELPVSAGKWITEQQCHTGV